MKKGENLQMSFINEETGEKNKDIITNLFKEKPENHEYCNTDFGILFNYDMQALFNNIESESIDLIFADPPYNIGKADWDTNKSIRDYIIWIEDWLSESHRILKPNGTIYIMGFSENLSHIQVLADEYFDNSRWLIWHYKNKPSMGEDDWVRSHEGILHLRKGKKFVFNMDNIRVPYNKHTRNYPQRTQGESSQYGNNDNEKKLWDPHKTGAKPRDVIDIPSLSGNSKENTEHPTQKPEELLRKLILAVTNEGDVVFDPFGGSGTTYVVCEQLRRLWVGAEINKDYCKIISKRIYEVPQKPVSYWIEQDFKRKIRRRKIRNGR